MYINLSRDKSCQYTNDLVKYTRLISKEKLTYDYKNYNTIKTSLYNYFVRLFLYKCNVN